MKYKIISMDFDGTLLTNHKTITEKTKKVLYKLKQENYIIVGVTARNFSSVRKVCDLDMFNYIIMNNGSYIYDVKNEKGEYVKTIDKEIAHKITDYFKNIATGIDYITIEKYYMFRNEGTIDSRDFVVEVNDFQEVKDLISRINIMASDNEEVEKYKKYIDNNFNEVRCIIMQDTDDGINKKWIALNPKGVNKYTAMQKLCEKLNINVDEVIFFGDSSNDIEMIENVGLGVAMGNALPQVKEKADEIALTNDEEGIANFLTNLIFTYRGVGEDSAQKSIEALETWST